MAKNYDGNSSKVALIKKIQRCLSRSKLDYRKKKRFQESFSLGCPWTHCGKVAGIVINDRLCYVQPFFVAVFVVVVIVVDHMDASAFLCHRCDIFVPSM